MDALLSEISKKRKDLSDPLLNAHGNKYMRKSDLEKARVEEERKKRDEEDRKKREEQLAKDKDKVSWSHA